MKIIVCVPGKQFDNEFLKSYTVMLTTFKMRGIDYLLSNAYDPNLYYVRNICLGGDNRSGRDQKPFGGQDYDYIFWLDSDIIFSQDQVNHMVDTIEGMKDDVHILSGLYRMMTEQGLYAVIPSLDMEEIRKTGTPQYATEEWANKMDGVVPVAGCGFGFLIMRKGVIERIKYPWFEPRKAQVNENTLDLFGDDISFCLKAEDAGIPVHVDTRVRVGHRKLLTLV